MSAQDDYKSEVASRARDLVAAAGLDKMPLTQALGQITRCFGTRGAADVLAFIDGGNTGRWNDRELESRSGWFRERQRAIEERLNVDDRTIVAVALRERDRTRGGMTLSGIAPNRHHNLCRQIIDWGGNSDEFEQGFMTASGEFVDRKRGAELALASGQIERLKTPPYLYSEDLW